MAIWNNGDAHLYHGTIAVSVDSILNDGVDLSRGKPEADFARGFYTTTWRAEADERARNRALRDGGEPAVVMFRVSRDALASLEIIAFARGSADAEDFWSFVSYCREGRGNHGRVNGGLYDVAVGPVAGNWRKRLILEGYDQVSFHTIRATTLLDESTKERIS